MSSALDRLAKRAPAKVVAKAREIDIPLDKIRFDPKQPRKAFHPLDGRIADKDTAYIDELATSIKENGLIESITVQEMDDGSFLVVVGECRTRAHLKLGLDTIRAVVRNDLTDAAKRLLYQLAENVNRQDLTDDELALSIRELMNGTADVAAMNQVQIAGVLGKSEGWVTRFVKFGDEELQRLWVKTGIADTVEKLYRLSILPKAAQVDIMRRVELPEGDLERLEKPLNRNVIDELAREAKIGKKPEQTRAPAPLAGHAAGLTTPAAAASAGNGVASDDSIGQALATAAMDGRANLSVVDKAPPAAAPAGKYQLSEAARAAILGSASTASPTGSNIGSDVREPVQPPVNCRVSVSNVIALLDVLKSNAEVRGALDGVQCDLNIPGPLAQLIANQLMGIIVDHKEVPSTVQMELVKLH